MFDIIVTLLPVVGIAALFFVPGYILSKNILLALKKKVKVSCIMPGYNLYLAINALSGKGTIAMILGTIVSIGIIYELLAITILCYIDSIFVQTGFIILVFSILLLYLMMSFTAVHISRLTAKSTFYCVKAFLLSPLYTLFLGYSVGPYLTKEKDTLDGIFG